MPRPELRYLARSLVKKKEESEPWPIVSAEFHNKTEKIINSYSDIEEKMAEQYGLVNFNVLKDNHEKTHSEIKEIKMVLYTLLSVIVLVGVGYMIYKVFARHQKKVIVKKAEVLALQLAAKSEPEKKYKVSS